MKKLPLRATILFFIRNIFVYPLIFFGLAYVLSTPLSLYVIDRYQPPNELKLLVAILVGLAVFFLSCLLLAYLKNLFFHYETSHEGIKIEQGILWKSSTYIPYNKIQNIDIHRSLISRMLGLSTIFIQTAGAGEFSSEGVIPGMLAADALELREKLLKHS